MCVYISLNYIYTHKIFGKNSILVSKFFLYVQFFLNLQVENLREIENESVKLPNSNFTYWTVKSA